MKPIGIHVFLAAILTAVITTTPAFAGSFSYDHPRDPTARSRDVPLTEFRVVGGAERVGVNRRTIEFDPISTLFINTASTRLVDARRLLRSRPGRGVLRPRHAVTVVEPAALKPKAKAFLRPRAALGHEDEARRRSVPPRDGISDRASQAGTDSPGWGRLRVHRPDGRDVIFEVGENLQPLRREMGGAAADTSR